ncbi:O-antigen ligase family protein [Qipengyuania sphaerica]|uniref:O-antigen ligase family protein n=1 Tax=Qipengyuania sphaerica TaxID=2867243 RepID=UPI001C870279|nr:O-antigen ligase family protein [Qipengyuania sphaerica]MBX7539388.1 O-antigen ligase family protein [Qipengyuania sphaerica]
MIGILLVIVSLPIFVVWLRGNPARLRLAAFGIGFLPFGIAFFNLDAALINWNMWPGHTKGLIVTILDSLALAILISSRERIGFPPFVVLISLYFLAACVSMAFSAVPMSSAFYALQTLRVLVLFLAVVIVSRQPMPRDWLCFGLASGAIFQAAFSIYEKVGGAVQASGTMSHQNLLGMMLHFATIPLIAMILAGDRRRVILLGALAGLLAAALTASRGTVAFLGLGIGILVCISLARKATKVKWQALGLGILAAAVVVPLMFSALANRTAAEKLSGDEERAAFERAAMAMWSDHPMGVGANRYVVTANVEGYSDEAGVVAVFGSRAAHVHNIYLLHAAEMGWLGLLTFIALIATAIVRGVAFAIRAKDNPAGDLVLGAAVALLTMSIHGIFEWIIILSEPQYLIAIALGIIAAARGMKFESVGRTRAPDPIIRQVMR